VNDIEGAKGGSYWDGGMTDYHCHMDYASKLGDDDIVLIPHFQQHLVAGWLDKVLKWRHPSSRFLDHVVVLAPSTSFVAGLPNGKIPDRQDFKTYMDDFDGRCRYWTESVAQSQLLVDALAAFINGHNGGIVQDL
jgi:hypothetical protein